MTKVLNGCNNFFNVYQLQAYLKMSRQLLFSKYSVISLKWDWVMFLKTLLF